MLHRLRLLRRPRYAPLQDLSPLADGTDWRATGSEPLFELTGGLPLPGWNMVELACERDVTSVAAEFTFELANGHAFSVELPLRVGKVSKRMVYVPLGVKRVLFCPMNARGTFRLTHFCFSWLTPWFAHDRLSQRLAHTHADYRDLARAEILRRLRAQSRADGVGLRKAALAEYEKTFISLCARRNYRQWQVLVEAPRQTQARAYAIEVVAAASHAPAFDVRVAVQSADEIGLLIDTVKSLTVGQHADWRLWVAVAPAWRNAVAEALDAVAETKGRVVLASLDEGAARVGWDALLADGEAEWVTELVPGDVLAPGALVQIAAVGVEQPEAVCIYTDHDERDPKTGRRTPRFKPDWNPDWLLTEPYIGRLVVYRRSMLEWLSRARGVASDLAAKGAHGRLLGLLAALGEGAAKRVCHIPEVLCHCATGTADTTALAAPDAVRHYLQAEGTPARVALGLDDTPRIHWPLPDPAPLVSLLIPTRDGYDILQPCVDAILERTGYAHFELLILDNQSRCPRTLAYLEAVSARDERVRVLRWDQPFNYSAINNFGARHARGQVLGLVNNDVEPIGGEWLEEMVRQAMRPEIGCVGAKLYYPNETIQHAGVVLGIGGVAGHAHRFFRREESGYMGRLRRVQNFSAVTAACLLLRRPVFEQVGGLNEPDLAVAYNDVDLCLRVGEAGYRNLWTPYAELYHHESISRGADDTPKKQARARRETSYMRRKWGDALDNDPAYNANLSLVHEDFSLR